MMFSFTLIKEPRPAWLSFFLHCWQSTYHLKSIRDYTHFHWFCWASVMQLGQESSVSPLPNLVRLAGSLSLTTPWHPSHSLWLLTGGGNTRDPVLLLRKWSTFIYPAASHRQERPKQTVTQHAERCWNIWDILPVWDSCPVRPKFTRMAFSLPFSPIPLLLSNTPVINMSTSEGRHFKSWDFKNWKLRQGSFSTGFQIVLKNPMISQMHPGLLPTPHPHPTTTHLREGQKGVEFQDSTSPIPFSSSTPLICFCISKVLKRFPLQKRIAYFLKSSLGTTELGKGLVPKSQSTGLGPRVPASQPVFPPPPSLPWSS